MNSLYPTTVPTESAKKAGFRFGAKGTHTSRTMMLAELTATLAAVPERAGKDHYALEIVEGNCLGKATKSTRRLTFQRLTELYGLDPAIPIFRVMRRLWTMETTGHPLLALQCAVARDPLLAATAGPVLSLPHGSELRREAVSSSLRDLVGDRLNEATLEKVVRNASSSWVQSGHLTGRTFKKRVAVKATPATVALALYLAYAAGFRGQQLFTSGWMALLDCNPACARDLAFEAKRIDLIDLRIAGDIVDLVLDRLDPLDPRR